MKERGVNRSKKNRYLNMRTKKQELYIKLIIKD